MVEDRHMPMLKWGALAVSLLWMVAAGWGELSKMELPDDFRSAAYKRQAENVARAASSAATNASRRSSSTTTTARSTTGCCAWSSSSRRRHLIAALYNKVQQRRERQDEEERERRAVAQLKRIRAEQEELRRLHEATRRTVEEAVNHDTTGRPA